VSVATLVVRALFVTAYGAVFKTPVAEVPAAAIDVDTATPAPTLRSAVSAELVGAVVTATVAPVIVPLNGIAIVAMLLVERVPSIVRVMVVGASAAVDMVCPFKT